MAGTPMEVQLTEEVPPAAGIRRGRVVSTADMVHLAALAVSVRDRVPAMRIIPICVPQAITSVTAITGKPEPHWII